MSFFIPHLSQIYYEPCKASQTWGFHLFHLSLSFCFSSISIQQFLHLISVLLTKVFLCSNSKSPFPLIALLQIVASIPRQSRGKRVQTAARGMGSLVTWKLGMSLDWTLFAACFTAPSIPIAPSSPCIIFKSSTSLTIISTSPIFLLDLASCPSWHFLT